MPTAPFLWHLGAVKHNLEMLSAILKQKDATSKQIVYSVAPQRALFLGTCLNAFCLCACSYDAENYNDAHKTRDDKV